MKYDVVIVGCGPAGASLGYLLLKNNIKVAIIDKKSSLEKNYVADFLHIRVNYYMKRFLKKNLLLI